MKLVVISLKIVLTQLLNCKNQQIRNQYKGKNICCLRRLVHQYDRLSIFVIVIFRRTATTLPLPVTSDSSRPRIDYICFLIDLTSRDRYVQQLAPDLNTRFNVLLNLFYQSICFNIFLAKWLKYGACEPTDHEFEFAWVFCNIF